MANENIKVISNREDIVAIADNIRTLTGVTGELTLAEMATAKGSGNQGGVNLPELTNPASEDEVFLNQEYIDGSGNKKTGTFTITEEVDTQIDLISQIKTKVNNLPNAGGNSSGGNSSGESSDSESITILNSTNASLTIGGYTLAHGDSVKIPFNLSVVQPIIFTTMLNAGTIVNATGATTPTRITNTNLLIGTSGSSTVSLKIGLIIIGSVSANSIVEIYTQ